jgi:hypothetical protein
MGKLILLCLGVSTMLLVGSVQYQLHLQHLVLQDKWLQLRCEASAYSAIAVAQKRMHTLAVSDSELLWIDSRYSVNGCDLFVARSKSQLWGQSRCNKIHTIAVLDYQIAGSKITFILPVYLQ